MEEISIEINIEEEKWTEALPCAEKILKEAVTAALNAAGFTANSHNIEVSVLLANDAAIQLLNRDYRGKDNATNVLSFPLEEFVAGEYGDVSGYVALGDIIFAIDTIQKEALEQNKTLENHFTHLAVHGTLHLIGHDHENDAEAEIMEALEVRILQKLGVDNPYDG